MLELILTSLYLFLPAYIANGFPTIFAQVKLPLSKPINEKAFGSHKTWKGFYVGYLGALLTLAIQLILQENGIAAKYSVLYYTPTNIFICAFIFGIGALTGDLLKSFFKRRIGIKPGQPWPLFDQVDFILGATLFLLPFIDSDITEIILAALIVTPAIHLLANITAYHLGLKKVWW